MSSVFRANQCARLTCKSCSCFKRVCDSLSENLRLSTAFQQLLDAMSDDDSSLSGDSDVESSDSDTIFSDRGSFFPVLVVQIMLLLSNWKIHFFK